MNKDTAKKVIATVEEKSRSGEEFDDKELQEFAFTIEYLLSERVRKEEVLALAAALLTLDEYKKDLQKRVEYARIGGLKEREATLLEILDQIDRALEAAVTMKINEYASQENVADDIKTAILEHLEPTLGKGRWHAREQEAILHIISKAIEGYLIVKV